MQENPGTTVELAQLDALIASAPPETTYYVGGRLMLRSLRERAEQLRARNTKEPKGEGAPGHDYRRQANSNPILDVRARD